MEPVRLEHTLAPVLAAVAAALLLAACASEAPRAEPPVPAVEAVPARLGALPLEERLSGVVKAESQVAVHPEIEASVAEVYVRTGEAVDRGQPLVRLVDAELRDRVRQAEADLQLAEASAAEARARVAEIEAQATRSRALAAEELVSEMDLETLEARLDASQASARQAEAGVAQAEAVVAERKSALGKTTVRSPVAGRVGQRQAEVGMRAAPGTTLFVVGNLDRLIVEVPLTERMMDHVREGQPVRITAPGLDGPVEATLSRVSPFLDEGSFSTVGEIDIANTGGRLMPGAFVHVDVLYGESDEATLVPTSALWDDPGSGVRGVWVVGGGAAESGSLDAGSGLSEQAFAVAFRPVEVLAEGRGSAGVRGVEEGEWVVTVGQHLLGEEGGDAPAEARVRPTTWARVEELQGLQREDLLRGFLDKQQRIARERGAVPPSNEEFLGRAGEGGDSGEGG
ncbi:MAG TPA: efflux RND transporter periplasmic adaptor subunit [Thermoanaerobaculia bacterium]|nr:efflux RND transporter periplasmic adaptor subunit [Thermoanaerobaculia bacterium]